MRYIELLEAVDVVYVRKNVARVAGEALKSVISDLYKEMKSKEKYGDEKSEIIDRAFSIDDSSYFYRFTNRASDNIGEFIFEYLDKKYKDKDIKNVNVSFKLKGNTYGDINTNTMGGNAGVRSGYYAKGGNFGKYYNINVVIDGKDTQARLISLAVDYIIDEADLSNEEFNNIALSIINMPLIIHELEHIEDFIKTNDHIFYNHSGVRNKGLLKLADKKKKEEKNILLTLSNIARNPSLGDLNKLLYYSSNEELNTFTTQAVNNIITNYDGIDYIQQVVDNEPDTLDEIVMNDEHVLQVKNWLNYALERLDEPDEVKEKLKIGIDKTIRKLYTLVFRKLHQELNKHNLLGKSTIGKFTKATNNEAAKIIANKIINEMNRYSSVSSIKLASEEEQRDLIRSDMYEFMEPIDALKRYLPNGLEYHSVVEKRINSFKARVTQLVLSEIAKS